MLIIIKETFKVIVGGISGKWLRDITDVSTIILLLIRLRLQEIGNMLVNKVAKGTVLCAMLFVE